MKPSTQKIKSYIQNNWFKLGLALLFIFIALKKDLSFNLNLNTPLKVKQPIEKQSQPVQQKEKSEERELYTENSLNNSSVTDRFKMPSIGEESKPAMKASAELAKISPETINAYIKRFAHVAISERKKFGIPASIIIANGMVNSFAGKRDLAQIGNNHFALLCTEDWQGDKGTYAGKCYRHYENAWTSFRDHSFFLTTGANEGLKELGKTDYKTWAKAIGKLGYSEEKNLAKQLIKIIEEYGLDELDIL